MKVIRRSIAFWIVILLAAIPGTVGGQSSLTLSEFCRIDIGAPIESSPAGGDWPMFRHDKSHTGFVQSPPSEVYFGANDLRLYSISTANCAERWSFLTGGAIKSSPAVEVDANGSAVLIYVGSDDGKVYAVTSNGDRLWQFAPALELDRTFRNRPPGPVRSSPLLTNLESITTGIVEPGLVVGTDDGHIYLINRLQGEDKARFPSRLMGVNAAGGNVIQEDFLGPIRSSPVADIVDEEFQDIQIYFGSFDRSSWAFEDSYLPNTATGRGEIAPSGVNWLDSPVYASIAVGDDDIFYVVSSVGSMFAIRPDLVEQWRLLLSGDVMGSPAVGSSGKIFIGTMSGTMHSINPNGTFSCSFQVFGPDGRANSGDELLYGIQSSPAITPDGLVIFGANDGYLYVIDEKSCVLRASFKTRGPIISSPLVTQFDEERKQVMFGSGDGTFYILSLFD